VLDFEVACVLHTNSTIMADLNDSNGNYDDGDEVSYQTALIFV